MLDLSTKRIFDVTVACAALIVSAPLVGLAALAIKLDSRGPVLFRQVRVGKHRQPIETWKLRTMVTEASLRGPQVTADRDPRITAVGRWLRKTKVDELPQLLNVLRGEMSIVGPRPEVPRYVAHYRPEWEALFSVRPGLTDRASLVFRDEESLLALARDRETAYREVIMPIKLSLALAGVTQRSVRKDLRVMFETAIAVLKGGSEHQALEEARRQIATLNRNASRS